jgi:hypothetical protein
LTELFIIQRLTGKHKIRDQMSCGCEEVIKKIRKEMTETGMTNNDGR